ncbi:MAG: class I SAM-dependent methyltransferase [Negativicutes bacterium]
MQQFVTTIKAADEPLINKARATAVELNLPYLNRNNFSLKELLTEANSALVFEKYSLALHSINGIHRFHLNLAGLRIQNIERGFGDNMVSAMGLGPSCCRVLDCTLGMASDAIVAAYSVGTTGCVHGCEQSALLHYITKAGLVNFLSGKPQLDDALRRITTTHGDYRNYLEKSNENDFDVIYFDPMFTRPQHKSSAFTPIRGIVCDLPLAPETLKIALSKTANRVVVKLSQYSTCQIRFDDIIGGKHAAIRYGVIYRR